MISQLDDNSGEFAVGLLKELARAYLTATSSDNTRAQVCMITSCTVEYSLYHFLFVAICLI